MSDFLENAGAFQATPRSCRGEESRSGTRLARRRDAPVTAAETPALLRYR